MKVSIEGGSVNHHRLAGNVLRKTIILGGNKPGGTKKKTLSAIPSNA